ncbi:MAG: aspartate aminotransferase family protein [Bacteroidota bacterium]
MLSNRQLFLAHQAQTTNFPLLLEVSKADGVYIYDTNGKPHIDFISGISVSSLGHGNEAVKEAIKKQVDDYMHLMVYGEYVQEPTAQLAAKLVSYLPDKLNTVYFVNSGAEATDGALKLAKRVTQKSKIIACKNAYHGSTHAALSLNSHEYYTQPFRPLLPNIGFIEFNNIESLSLIDNDTACVIVETIQGEAGYIVPNIEFLQALRSKCTEQGCLLIFDEIQAGIGKTGKMFAFEHWHIIPDVLLLGKALGAGMPIGAFVSSQQFMHTLTDNPILGHITTFGGHPVIAAAALAGLQELERLDLMSEIETKEALIRQQLVHPKIKQIRGKGLMLAVELNNFDEVLKVCQLCLQDGLIIDWFLFANNCIRLVPPLIITHEQIEKALSIILSNLNKL